MAELAPLAPNQPEGFAPSDYSVAVEPSRQRVTVVFNGAVVADSRRAPELKETRRPPDYSLPPEATARHFLVPSDPLPSYPTNATPHYCSLWRGTKTQAH